MPDFQSVRSELNLGRWRRQGLYRHISFALILLLATLISVYSDWLHRIDLLIYDTHQHSLSHPPPEDIVVIAVDEYSLSQLGRWPWSRRVHAQLIDQLTQAGARAIVLDIIFSEVDSKDPEGDRMLAQAIERNQRLILPVMFEQRYVGGAMIETLPLPALLAGAAGLGHAHVELDADGITRSVYLKEGLGDAFWPHLSVALLDMLGELPEPLPGLQDPAPRQVVFNTLQRNYHVLIPYAGPPGHFQHISYAKFIESPVLPEALKARVKDKIVFIGATAFGLGDLLPTPVSGLNHPMSGVEINVNVFDALRQGAIIEPLPLLLKLLLSSLIVLLPVVLFPRMSPRAALMASGTMLLGTMGLSSVLLIYFYIWFPPAAVLLTLLLAYPLWSWRRLEYANQFLSDELTRLNQEPVLLGGRGEDVDAAMMFVKNVIPVKGWSLYWGLKDCIASWGEELPKPPELLPGQSSGIWHYLEYNGEDYWLGVSLLFPRPFTEANQALMLDVVRPYLEKSAPPQADSIELFEARVMQVQQAENRIRLMRRFLDDSLNQMADGVLVINNLGQLSFINARALQYLGIDENPRLLREKPVIPMLDTIDVDGAEQWPQLLAETLLNARVLQVNGRTADGLDVLIQINPLSLETPHTDGIIINLSDISHIRSSERQRLETFSFLSHDLRSPLVSLLALVEMARQDTATDQAMLLKRVEDYAARTLSLADDFLRISQLEQRSELNLEIVDIAMVAGNAVDAAWDDSAKKQIKLNDQLPADPVYVRGDPGLLERALLNLLNNAIKYSPPGSSIDVNIVACEGRISVCVKDNGLGIPGQDLPHIFDHYFRVHRPEETESMGSGLGLSFVKSVLEKHGGSVQVESKEGEGSCFCIVLDRVAAADMEEG